MSEQDTREQVNDTREKLEADILVHYKTPAEKLETVKGWLDRQAAITEEQTRCKWVTLTAEKIADLQSQLDEVSRAYKERGRMLGELAGELERLQGVVRVQAESFRGMEQELKAALAEKDGKRGKRKLPKPVKWPRDANGKLVGFGYGGASSITFTRYGYCVDYGDGTAVGGRYGEEARA